MKKTTHAAAAAKTRRAEIRSLRTQRRAAAREAHADLRALLKQADKTLARHRERDQILRRRIQILESRLG